MLNITLEVCKKIIDKYNLKKRRAEGKKNKENIL